MAGKPLDKKRRSRGEGTAEQRGPTTWRLRVYLGKDPVTGHPRQTSRTVHAATKTEALKQLRELTREVDQGKIVMGANATLETLLAEWVRHLERTGKKPSTVESYRLIVDRHLTPALGKIELRRLDGHTLDNYYATKAGQGGSALDDGRPLAVNTIRLHHAILSSALTQAVKWGWITSNPAERATPPARQKTDRHAPDPGQIRRLIDASADDPDLAFAVALGAITGCRRGELCGLRWGDVDWDRGLLRIERQRQPGPGGDRTVAPKTGVRVVSIGAGGIAVLRRHQAATVERAAKLGVDVPADGWMLSDDCGATPLPAKGLGEAIRGLSGRAGVPITTHLLRYFAATQMVGAGVDVRTAAGRLGHTPEVMLRVYTDFMPRRDLEAAVGLEALVLEEGDDA